MSFEKARDLVQLAIMASVRHGGVSLAEIVAEFGVSHRTAQRMTQALESCFTGVEISEDEDRRRHWILRAPNVAALDLHDDAALEALDMAVRGAEREGRMIHARALRALREKHLMHMPRRRARRAEADAEAFLADLETDTEKTLGAEEVKLLEDADLRPVIDFAIQMEAQARDNYLALGQRVEDGELREFCEELAAEEQRHFDQLTEARIGVDTPIDERPAL